ncbi:hypothetical protein AALA98_17250 [Lachnospiraceae bacterium 45-W7]
MDVDELKSLVFEMLKEHDALFSDMSLDDETDTIFIKSSGGERFIITVSPVTADETLIGLWAKKNPELMSLALGILNMREVGAFTEEESEQYLSKILEFADNSIIENLSKFKIDG